MLLFILQDLFLQSEQEILANDGSHIFFYDQTLNRQSNTICTHENWAPKMLARSESDTKNTFLNVDSNIVLWGKSRNSFFFCPSWKIRLEIFDVGKMMSFLVARFTIFKSQQQVIFGGKVHSFSNQTLLFGLMLKIVKKVFFCTIHFYCSLVNRKERCCKQDQIQEGTSLGTWNWKGQQQYLIFH